MAVMDGNYSSCDRRMSLGGSEIIGCVVVVVNGRQLETTKCNSLTVLRDHTQATSSNKI